jgi:DNA-binding NtrC family response regulator
LVVDDEADVVDYLVDALGDEGYETIGVTSGAAALSKLGAASFELVIADVEMPGMRGPEFMTAVHARHPEQLVLLITAFGSIESAAASVRGGACDFLAKPFTIEALVIAIERALRERQQRREIVRLRQPSGQEQHADLISESPAMRRVVELARKVAPTNSTVLLTGESGVGKGAVAELIHRESRRTGLVQVNCAALPPTLVEAELFGVRRGAYTDAREDRPGLFVEAEAGTLFLDEVGELPLDVQAKLLQVLETRRIRPVGATTSAEVDVRLIAATNRALEADVRSGRFRPDLFHRLNVIRIAIPPLRERRDDIAPLVDLLLPRLCERIRGEVIGLSAPALRWMLSYDWPGNVRELTHVLERAVALADHDTIVLDDVRTESVSEATDLDSLTEAARRGDSLAAVEEAYIGRVLARVQGNKARAARILGIDRRTLYRRLGASDEFE